MAEHLGGEALGGPPVATGNQKLLFDGLTVEGEAHRVDLLISGLLIAQGGAPLNAKNPTGVNKTARTLDDVDALLDFIYTTGSFRVDERRFLFQNELMSRVRTILSGLSGRDVVVTGALVDGTAINAAGGATKAFTMRIPIPLSLRDELFPEDGDTYKQGTEVLKKGAWLPAIAAIAGNVAFANGGVVLSGLAFDTETHVDPHGDKFYVGPTWNFHSDDVPAVCTLTQLPRAKRLLLMVDVTGATSGPYTMHGAVESNKLTAAAINDGFNANRRRNGGDNTGARAVMLHYPRKDLKLAEMDFTATQVYVKNEAAAVQTLLGVTHEAVDGAVAARAKGDARTANKGVEPKGIRPTPPSAIGTNEVHPRNQSFLGVHQVKA